MIIESHKYAAMIKNECERGVEQRRIKERIDFDKRCRMCLGLSLLCFTFIIFIQVVVASIILYTNRPEPYNGNRLELKDGYETGSN
tara:strand:+ start:95 stop:352 length:258 start_codon:yes stop_codon:yes gene_type:complete